MNDHGENHSAPHSCKHEYQKYHYGAGYCNINYVSAKVFTLTFTGTAYSPQKKKGNQPLKLAELPAETLHGPQQPETPNT